MEAIADLAERFSFDEIRVSHEQNLVLPHVRLTDLAEVWEVLAANGLGTPNAGLLSDIIACPGLDYCNLANARSIPVAQSITQRFSDLKRQHELGELKINIYGCINACRHHPVDNIALPGVHQNGAVFSPTTPRRNP